MIKAAKKELFERIIRIYPTLSPKKKRVADFILHDYKNLFLMSAKELAQRCQVSEPTIIRLVMDLGFEGYPEFERYVKSLLHVELTSVERMVRAPEDTNRTGTLGAYVRNTVKNMETMLASVTEQELDHMARTIHAAQSVIVAGYRASAALAYYFGYILRKIRDGVTLDTTYSTEVLDQIAAAGQSTLLVIIAFPRYPRRAVELVEYAKYYDVQTIAISDSPKSPIVALADYFVTLDMEGLSFVDPFGHIMTFFSALIHQVAYLDRAATLKRLTRIEDGVQRRGEFFSVENGEGQGNPLDLSYYGRSHFNAPDTLRPRQGDRGRDRS